ncbi:eukaryotic translation initiation factor 4 gamma 1-like [Salvelinus namaycush]|uniref:Eukaryotic translation initiation factor 4 gamma 1-like n=1 Tax=Salvelinus namaycush TaxID=8040 RepID=A0A8U0P4Y9_SALNM|nr:eukaryotic translation initiation factor 4 gamma 1-like [Salvelinus namaycush]
MSLICILDTIILLLGNQSLCGNCLSSHRQANLDEQQTSDNQFVRTLMTSICQSAVICENPYKVDVEQITQRAKLLQRYLSDEKKELQALYALQALMVHMEQPANLLRMFFDTLYDEDR